MGYGNIDEDDVDYIYDHEQTNLLISNTVSSDMGALRPSGSVPWLILIFLFPALGGFLFGYDIGGVSSAFNGNANSGYQGHNLYYTFDMTDGTKEAVISTSLLGAILGSLAVFGSGDFLSRRGVLLIGSSFYFGGALIEGAAFNLPLLFVGRLVYGIGIGFCMHSAPLYIAEITPPRYRGLFISAKECFIVLGILTGYINGYIFQSVNYGWRYIFYFATIPAAVLFTGMLFIPHSPRWLALRGLSGNHSPLVRDDYLQLAHAALAKIRRLPIEIVQPEFNEIYDSLDKQLKEAPVSYKDFFTNRALMRGLMIGCGLVIFQQISGQPSVLYYASTVFADAGLTSAGAAAMATIGVGTVKLLMTIVSTGVVDKFGRRILLSVGIFLMILALLTLGSCSIGITQDSNSFSSFQSYATIIAMMVFVSGYQLGFGPISWLIISEIFPLRVRSKALSIAVICNFGANLIVTLTYLTLQNLLTIAGAYFLYGGIAVLSLVFVILFVIETKGCTLEQIEVILSGRNWIVFNPRRIMQLFKKKDTHGDYDD